MDEQEKLAYFERTIQKEAKTETDERLKQYENNLKADFETYQKQIEEKYHNRFLDQQKNLIQEFNKELSESQIHQQRDVYLSKQEIKEKIFKEFRQAIESYKTEAAYAKQLERMAETILDYANGETCDLYIDHTDQNLQGQLKEVCQHDIKLSDRPFLGGIRGVLRKRNILIDYSFQTLLEREADDFEIKEVKELDQ